MPELDLTLDPGRLDAIRHGTVVVVDRPAVFRITGSGALGCLQGLFTNDLESVGDGSLSYGAMLTPKGMIVVDAWVVRVPGALTLIAPAGGREATLQIFQRSLPPRLAKAEDQTGETVVAWVLGERGLAATSRSAIGGPDTAGRAAQVQTGPGPLLVAAGTEVAPFAALIVGPEAVVELAVQQLEAKAPRGAGSRICRRRGSWRAGRRWASRSTRRRCPRRSATTRSAASPTPRGATPDRRRSPGSTSGATPTASCADSPGASRASPTAARCSRARRRWARCVPRSPWTSAPWVSR